MTAFRSGNLPSEIITGYLNKSGDEKYNPVAYIDVIERFYLEHSKKTPWGYRIQSLIGGLKKDVKMKKYTVTVALALLLAVLSVASLFIGVIDVSLAGLLHADALQWQIFLASRLPRLLAILCTGVGMSIAGLIMQQLCMNKFISPPRARQSLLPSSASSSRFFLCRIPRSGGGHSLRLRRHSWARGCSCFLSSAFSLKM